MGCGDACPIFPGKRYEDWVLTDPAHQDLETVRRIRDELDQRIQTLRASCCRRARLGELTVCMGDPAVPPTHCYVG